MSVLGLVEALYMDQVHEINVVKGDRLGCSLIVKINTYF